MLLQSEARPISQEQLVNEVKGIYAGLVMVEKKCVGIDQQQSISQRQMPNYSYNLPQATHDTMWNMAKRKTDEDGKSVSSNMKGLSLLQEKSTSRNKRTAAEPAQGQTPEHGGRPNKLHQARTFYYDTARDEQYTGTQNPVAESPNRGTPRDVWSSTTTVHKTVLTFQPSLTKARNGSTNPETQILGSTLPPSSPVFTATDKDFSMLLQPETRPITASEWKRFPHPKELEYIPDDLQTSYEHRGIVKRSLYKYEPKSSNSRQIEPQVEHHESQSDPDPKPLQAGPEKQHRESFESTRSFATCSGTSETHSTAPEKDLAPIPSPLIIPSPKPRELKLKSRFFASKMDRLGAKIEKFEFMSSKRRSRDLEEKKIVATAECVSCLDDIPTSNMTLLGCSHSYCKPCFTILITTAVQTESLFPPKCCLNEIPLKTVLSVLGDEHRDSYKQKAAEWAQPPENGPTIAKSPDVWKIIEQFVNTTASASSKPAKSSDPAVSDTVPKGGLRMQRLKRFLPMFLNGSRYNTTPDTGSLENAISADEARRLGLKITGRGRQFLMGNGGTTISRGIVRLKCAFALGERCLTRQSFHVIDNLVVPVIIGKKFLDISETMTSNQHRLEAVWISAKKAFRVMHLNRPRQLVRCYVNGKLVHANPDTGSEVDLMSPFYARENMLKIEALEEGEDWVQFADGSTAKLLGKTHVDLDIYDGRYKSATGYRGRFRTFYLLDGLRTDVLLGEEALYDMHIFTEHEDSFVDSDDCGLSVEMNLITWFDKRTRQMSDTLAVLSSARSKHMTPSEAQELLNKLHARELHQRELAPQKLAALPAAERPAQERLEKARQLEYDTARDLLIQKRNAAALGSQQHAIRSPAHDPGDNTARSNRQVLPTGRPVWRTPRPNVV